MAEDSASSAFHVDPSLENAFVVQHDEQMLANLAQNAAQELLFLAEPNCALWLNVPGSSFETLNMAAYAQTFPRQMGVHTMALKTEATRASAVFMLDPNSLVEFLMDAVTYGTMLPGLVSAAATTKVYNCPTGREESYDGAMQMMTVEMVFPSPLVAARKCTFLRCVKKLEQGAIAVIDVSLDDGARCRKMPSGLVIQPITFTTCKVTAIDHVLVDGANTHGLFNPCMSGLLFGARRWVTSMARQCARIRYLFDVTNCTLNVNSRWRKATMKLADSLLANFTSSVAAYPEDAWTVQCGLGTEQDIKIMYKTLNESSNSSHTVVVCASASFLVPLHMEKAFDLLNNNMLRAKWDVLLNGGPVEEEVRVANGAGSNDAVSILHVKHGHGANRVTMMILQNTHYDASGAFMVYSSLDKEMMEIIRDKQAMSGITLFPAGFSLVPLTDPAGQQDGAGIAQPGETVITAGFQILMTDLCPRSVASVAKIMTDSIANIKDVLLNSHPVSIQPVN